MKEIKTTEQEITVVCEEIRNMLIEKNRSYGDSALNPVRIFSKADAMTGIDVRLDDKLSRLASGNHGAYKEDVELDIMGYLILKRVLLRRRALNPLACQDEVLAPPH